MQYYDQTNSTPEVVYFGDIQKLQTTAKAKAPDLRAETILVIKHLLTIFLKIKRRHEI